MPVCGFDELKSAIFISRQRMFRHLLTNAGDVGLIHATNENIL